jgi:hypothetical protein
MTAYGDGLHRIALDVRRLPLGMALRDWVDGLGIPGLPSTRAPWVTVYSDSVLVEGTLAPRERLAAVLDELDAAVSGRRDSEQGRESTERAEAEGASDPIEPERERIRR